VDRPMRSLRGKPFGRAPALMRAPLLRNPAQLYFSEEWRLQRRNKACNESDGTHQRSFRPAEWLRANGFI